MIVIAYNYEGYISSIVSAKSKELATVYFQGANIDANSVKVLEEDFTPLSDHPTGVMPILKTEQKELKSWQMSDYHTFTLIVKS